MAAGDITIKYDLRPCTVHKMNGLFHKWTVHSGKTYALVETETGHVLRVSPEKVRFTDKRAADYAYTNGDNEDGTK